MADYLASTRWELVEASKCWQAAANNSAAAASLKAAAAESPAARTAAAAGCEKALQVAAMENQGAALAEEWADLLSAAAGAGDLKAEGVAGVAAGLL